MNKISVELADFLKFVDNVLKDYKLYKDYLDNEDKILQDILHSFELGKLSTNEKGKLATRLVTNRKDRRYYKDKVEELEPIFQFFTEPTNKKVLDNLKQVLGDVRKTEKYHANRNYKPKILKLNKESKND